MRWIFTLPLGGSVRTEYRTAQVDQTGEVRLLSKLLNQKVDTVCCMCSRGKTLTVQGLWVCKKTESLVEMHPQALELLTFRYAYKTVLDQSKQKKKKKKKGLKQCYVDGHSRPHFYSLIYNSCQVTTTNPHSTVWPLCHVEKERKMESEELSEGRKIRLWASAQLIPDLQHRADHQADCFWQLFDTGEERVLNSSQQSRCSD